MKSNSKHGFTIAESLVGLVLFSFILMLYLPALYLGLEKYHNYAKQAEEWRVFYELSQIELAEDLSNLEKEDLQAGIISSLAILEENEVKQFFCHEIGCSIEFIDGSSYDVELQAIKE